MPTLNGRTWAESDFLNMGHAVPKAPDTAGTPAFLGILNDMLAEQEKVQLPGAASVTSNTIASSGTKSWTLAAATTLRAGTYRVYSASAPTNYMVGTLAADLVAGTAFSITVAFAGGAGTFTDWIIARVDANGRFPITSKTGAYTAVQADIGAIIKCSGTWTLSLTAAATLGAGWWCVVHVTSGTVTIDPNGSETIDGAATKAVTTSLLLYTDGANWFTALHGA
jgi:hypothetical protein